jgi:glycosyltransferase 2 family protein
MPERQGLSKLLSFSHGGKSVAAWLRISITLLCAAALIYFVDVRIVVQTLARCDLLWALAGIAALTLDRVLMSYKWGLLLAIRGYGVTLTQRLMVYCSAMMWGLALPSTVGADGVRVLLVRRFGVRVDDALATILVERAIGFISALATAIIGLIILRLLAPAVAAHDLAIACGVLALATTIGVVAFSFSGAAVRSVQRLLPRELGDSKAAQVLRRLHEAYRSLAFDRPRLAAFSALTFLEQMLTVACYGIIAVTLGVEFNPLFLLSAVPLAILISRLPLSIDGIGVYEGVFMAVMTLGGVRPEDSLAISLAARALQIVVWFPWWLAMTGQTGAIRPPTEPVSPPSG